MADRPAQWILLRGLTRERGHWGGFPSVLKHALQAEGREVDVLLLDLPGNGQLFRQRSPTRVLDMVESCRDELQRRGLAPPYHVLAMSLGGMVCAEWALRYPHELAGAVLINTSMRPFSPVHWRLRPRQYLRMLRMPWMGLAARELAILRMTTRLQSHPEALLRGWCSLAQQHPVSALNALRQLWAAARYRAARTAPRVPLLLLASSQDALVDVRCSRALATAWAAPIQEHPQAGHDLPQDDAVWTARQVLRWLRSV